MASEWKKVQLGDVIQVTHGWPFKSELYAEELTGRPIVVSIGNFNYSGGFRFDSTTVKEYRGDYPPEFNLKPGEILLVMTCQTAGGEILGIPARVPDDGKQYLHNQRLGRIILKNSQSDDPDFLYYLFLSPSFNRELSLTASGTKILHTAPSRIEAFSFLLPSPDEQRQIGRILRVLDDKIELNRKMNDTLEAMALALFKSWFVDFDPVRAKAEGRETSLPARIDALLPDSFEESAFGLIPSGWRVTGLDSIATFLNGLALQKYPATETDFLPAIKIAQLRAGSTVNADKVSSKIPPAYVVEDGDVLFSWSGSLECVIWTAGKGALNQHLFKVTSDRFPKWFYLRWIGFHLPEFRRVASAKATTMGHIQRHHLTQALVVVPPMELIEAAATQFEPLLSAQITAMMENRTLASVRDSLLPKLMNGELRLPPNAREVEL